MISAAEQQQRLLDLGRGLGKGPVQVGSEVCSQALDRTIETGLSSIDDLLPRGGLPCGRVTQLVGASGSGRTSFLIAVMAQVASSGERSAVIDLDGDLDPASLLAAGIEPGWVWVIRPSSSGVGFLSTKDALWAADQMLRSGHFRLVCLKGLGRSLRTASLVRLQRQARETEAALLIMADERPLSAPGSLQLGFRPLGVEWSKGLSGLAEPSCLRVAVTMGKRRSEARVTFDCRPRRLLGHHDLEPDRRPAKWTENARPYARPWADEAADALAREVFESERRGPVAKPPPAPVDDNDARERAEGERVVRLALIRRPRKGGRTAGENVEAKEGPMKQVAVQ